ncbi:group 1 truncated hemoglobin [Geodermatophilus sp. YIM 151500]|uniref:group I truncated hemoglobin n=1 Tax=Geodermatophilus sp. YIM 151500 TaxID=2984531 RepID=UPI0021E3A8FE|nr:group 1 truncated hemoglobin [Geodermatophilus sp. YIM 151500]MCV2491779.1 group 1 truncated hemoglobin [Geodermatophilus sp. YIM 151500]
MSIYEQLGQDNGIRTAVDDFYRRVLADPELTAYFDGVDMANLRAHQTKLLVQVTGGPVQYEGRELAAAHEGLDIGSAEYERVVAHLVATLTDLGVEPATIGDIGAAIDGYRDDIVTANGHRG